jgi:hypothetical protein
MKTRTIILLLSTIIVSCRPEPVEKPTFTNVDLSWGDAWNKLVSVEVDSAKNTKMKVEERNGGTHYYVGHLNDSVFQKVNHIIGLALKQKHENEIGISVPDGSIYHLIIDNKIHSTVFESAEPTALDTIVSLLIEFNNYKLKISSDTSFNFESLSKIHPPLITETATFVPPVIKDDVIEK